jgi:hypothetical protein
MSKDVRDELKAILDDFVLFTDKTIGSNEPTELGVFLKQCGYPSAMDRLATELTEIINSQALQLLDRLEKAMPKSIVNDNDIRLGNSRPLKERQAMQTICNKVINKSFSAIEEERKQYKGELWLKI